MRDLTTGSVSRHLLQTTGFMLVVMVFQTLYFLVDLYWVGRLGKEAVAGVGVAGNLMFVVLAVTQMLGVGTTALISHAVGQKDRERARFLFDQSQVLAVLVAVAFFLAAWFARDAYAGALSADAATADLARQYLRWFVPAMALQFGIVSMGAALRGTGNFQPGMIVQSATVALNMVLAPVLMFGWFTHRPLGVAGAAIATLIAILVGTLWLLTWFLAKDAYLVFRPHAVRPDLATWRRLLAIGLPSGAEFGLMAVYLMVVYAISRPFGASSQAGFGIGMRIVQAGFMPAVALGFAVAPVAGQNFGARRGDRVRETMRSAFTLAIVVMASFSVLCHLTPARLVGVFSKDPVVIAAGVEYLRIVSWNFVLAGLVFVSSSLFQAIGNTVPSLLATAARFAVAVVPALLLSRVAGFEMRWVWYLGVLAVTLQFVVSALLLRRELRKRLAFDPAPAAASGDALAP